MAVTVIVAVALLGVQAAVAQPVPEDEREKNGPVAVDPASVPPLESEPFATPSVAEHEPIWREAQPPVPVEEVVEQRSATTKVFRNADGSLIAHEYTTPIHYLTDAGWVPIDNTLNSDPGRPGWVRSNGNDWSVAFGSLSEGLELSTVAGNLSVKPVLESGGFADTPVRPDVTPPRGKPSGDEPIAEQVKRSAVPEPAEVGYRGAGRSVELRYRVTATGVKEDIVLAGPDAANEFVFEVTGAGMSLDESGGVRLSGEIGDLVVVPPPTVETADGTDVSDAAGVHYELRGPSTKEGGSQLAAVVDREFLSAQPQSAFPLLVDPSFLVPPTEAPVVLSNTGATYSGGYHVKLGRDAAGVTWRAAARFNSYEQFIGLGYRVYTFTVVAFPPAPAGSPQTVFEMYEQGAKPTSFSQIGTGRPLLGTSIDPPPDPIYNYVYVKSAATMDRWLTQGLGNQWVGLRSTETGTVARQYDLRAEMAIYQPPQPSVVTNIADNQKLATTTPILHGQQVPGNGSFDARYEFQITTGPSPQSGQIVAGTVFCAPPQCTDPNWQVPVGALHEGVTYYAWVLTDWNYVGELPHPRLPDPVTATRRFTVDLGLGEGGPSPTDEVGSVPGQAESPAEGAPGPSLPGSKVTVNMVDGNLSLSLGTKTMGTLSGGVGLGFTYNSLMAERHGLLAEFFNDSNANLQIDDTTDVKVGERIDPTVYVYQGPIGLVTGQDPAKALARWTGEVTLPYTDQWQVGAISSDGIRVLSGTTVWLDRWATHAAELVPVFGPTFNATANSPMPIKVEWHGVTDAARAHVVVKRVSTGEVFELSPDWVTRPARPLPPGWTFNADAGSARWVGLADHVTSVSVFTADGSAHEFKAAGGGAYTPPITAPNDLLSVGDAGRFVLRSATGQTYTFRADGVLESVVSATDDRTPAALVYTYATNPVRLASITDPVSTRSVTLSYGGDAACGSVPAAATGLLCHIAFWDGTATTLTYSGFGDVVRITNPGGIVHDFGYLYGRLWAIRDPLANDAIAAGVRSNDLTTLTQIGYDPQSLRVTEIIQPAPTAGAPQPRRTYTYDDATRSAKVNVAGFSPSTGYASRVRYDSRNRIIEKADSAGLISTYGWDALDRLFSTTDPAGLQTTTFYDHASRPVQRYGPAPASSFGSDGRPLVGAQVPLQSTFYDEGIAGLAAAYWTNPFLAGGPALHDTGLGAGGALNRDWGTVPPVTPGPGGWSGRWSGYVSVAPADTYTWRVTSKASKVKVWIDEQLVVDHNQAEPASWVSTTGAPGALTAGLHRIRVDMTDTSGEAGLQVLWSRTGAPTYVILPGTVLGPNYGLTTRVVDPDGKVTATEYVDASRGIGPHHGLATATVADPASLALRTTTTYETPGTGSYLRRVGKTLPAGNSWTFSNYGGTEGPIAGVCGASGFQAGMAKRVTGPDPDGAGPEAARSEEFVYDAVGRQVGRRVGTTATIGSAGWACTTYDARGRMATQSWPSHGTEPSRIVTYTYAVGNNPLINRVSDTNLPAAAVSGTVDLLGRTVSYSDIWGNTTNTVFDQAGRLTTITGPLGIIVQNYDPATGRATTRVANGITLSTPTYDPFGRLQSVSYWNGSSVTDTYDIYGRPNGATITDNQGQTGDRVTRSLAGRIVDQEVSTGAAGFVDATPTAGDDSYEYDGAGRLTAAAVPGFYAAYGFDNTTGCTNNSAGRNTNRTAYPTFTTVFDMKQYCYDNADRLESGTDYPAGTITYDDHGNTTRLGSETFDFDSADRHIRTETATTLTSYRRDPLDRIAERSEITRVTHVGTSPPANAGAATVTVARPAETQPGDVIVAAVVGTALSSPGNISTEAGWNMATENLNGAVRTFVLWRTAAANDPTSWNFTVASSTNTSGALSSYRNVNPAAPVSTQANAAASLTSDHPVPWVFTPSDGHHLVHIAGFSGSTSAAIPGGTNPRVNLNAGASLAMFDRYQKPTGFAPPLTVTTPSQSRTSASITIALNPVTTSVVRYGYPGHTDNSQFARNTSGTVVEFAIGLPGGATYTLGANGYGFSHANLHGDTITTTDLSGNRTWTGVTGPYGERVTTADPVNTTPAGTSYRWHGEQQRLTDRGVTQMGARPYSSALGRFLRVDPIEGGCANDYVYVTDPVNSSDISGTECPGWLERSAGFFGWRAFVTAADRFRKGDIGGFFEALIGGGPTYAQKANEKAWEAVAKKAKGVIGGIAKRAASTVAKVFGWPVSVTATLIDFGCDYTDPGGSERLPGGPIQYA